MFAHTVQDDDPAVLKSEWRKLQRAHTHVGEEDSDYEQDIYDGFSSLGGYSIINKKLKSEEEAEDYIEKNTKKWEGAIAVKFANGKKLTAEEKKKAKELTAAYKKAIKKRERVHSKLTRGIAKKRAAAEKTEERYRNSIYAFGAPSMYKVRAPAEKKQFHKCAQCNSTLNLYFFTIGEMCPVCKSNVFPKEKTQELEKAKEEESAAFKEYCNRPKDTYIMVGGIAAC